MQYQKRNLIEQAIEDVASSTLTHLQSRDVVTQLTGVANEDEDDRQVTDGEKTIALVGRDCWGSVGPYMQEEYADAHG